MTLAAPETRRARAQADADRMTVLGIRHHGPGSARSVLAELDRVRPSMVLIEGPADAGPVLPLAGEPGLEPPVALLAYAPDAPRVSAFWPFAVFSPEWQALTWAARHGVPARFCDLPAAVMLATPSGDEPDRADRGRPGDDEELREDPLARLAAAAGYDDPERWWDDLVESRLDGGSPFAALTEAMAELRAAAPEGPRAAPTRTCARTHWPGWPRRPATTTRNAGGTTWSSPGWTAARRFLR